MKKKTNVVISIPYKLYIYLSKKKNEINAVRENEGKKLFTLSSFCNYIINTTTDEYLDLNDFNMEFIQHRSAGIVNYKINKICKRKVNIALSSYNLYKINTFFCDVNEMGLRENIKCILNLYFYKEEGYIGF